MAPRFVELADLRAESIVRQWSLRVPRIPNITGLCGADALPLAIHSQLSADIVPSRNCVSVLMLAGLAFLIREAILHSRASRAVRSQVKQM